MAEIARFALPPPDFIDTACRWRRRRPESRCHAHRRSEVPHGLCQTFTVSLWRVDVGKFRTVVLIGCKLRAERIKGDVVHLAHQSHVPPSGVAEGRVDDKACRRDIVGEASPPTVTRAKSLPLHRHARDEKFLECPCVEFVDVVDSSCQRDGLTECSVSVAWHIRFPCLAILPLTVQSEHLFHQPPYQVVLQRFAAHVAYILFFSHPFAIHHYEVAPLIAIAIALAALAPPPEAIGAVPAALCLIQ